LRRLGRLHAETLEDRRLFACDDIFIANPSDGLAPDYFEVAQGADESALDVLQNDFWQGGPAGPGIITAVSETSEGGLVTIAPDGRSLRYTAAADATVRDCFTYTVDDQRTAGVLVSIIPPVVLNWDYFSLNASPELTSQSIDVLANDTFAAGYAGLQRITAAALGEGRGDLGVSADGRALTFSPDAIQPGYYPFTYSVDGHYEGGGAIYVAGYLRDDYVTLLQNQAANSIGLLSNDFAEDVLGAAYTGPGAITAVGDSLSGGTVAISADGRSVSYTPAPGFVGRDEFTYTVDEIEQARVIVDVIRPVRNDVYAVAVDSPEDSFAVLLNDRFGREYDGLRRVTSVSDGSHGGRGSVSLDGTQVLYEPAGGFQGVETLQYTVDDRFTGEITVHVGGTRESLFPHFESLEALQQFLIQDALERYADQFGQPAWVWRDYPGIYPVAAGGPGIPAGDSVQHSATNVQVSGVDEGDVVETDGNFLYVLRNSELAIVHAWPVDGLEVASRTQLDGFAVAELLQGDRLTVISQSGGGPWAYAGQGADIVARPALAIDSSILPPFAYRPTTTVTVFDVSDRTAPAVVQQTKLDGGYRDARVVGDHVFVMLDNGQLVLPGPKAEPEDDAAGGSGGGFRYESRDAYLARVEAEIATLVEDLLPKYSSYDGQGELVRAGLITTPEELYRPVSPEGRQFFSIVSLDMQDQEPGIVASTSLAGSGVAQIYGAHDSLYVFDQAYSQEDATLTRILKFAWDGDNGAIQFVAQGALIGGLNNQFSADEHEGVLRVATTTRDATVTDWTLQNVNDVWTLREDAGLLELVGAARDIAPGELIRSARFVAARGFIVTFRQIDPLFALDLSDPESPQVLGELKVPGFSSYLQFLDENHILGIGQSDGFAPQLMLFDVTELAQPVLVDQFVFDDYSWSSAPYDHHAVSWFAEAGVLAIPHAASGPVEVDADGDGIADYSSWEIRNELRVFSIDTSASAASGDAIQVLGSVEHASPVLRSVAIEDVLYSIGTNEIKAVQITDPSQLLGERVLGDPPSPGDPPVFIQGSVTPDPRDDGGLHAAITAAQEMLRQTLDVPLDQLLLVTSEPSPAGYGLVFRHEDGLYLAQCDASGSAELVERDFEFAASRQALEWRNADLAEDVNADGFVSPIDALLVINRLNSGSQRPLAERTPLRSIGLTSAAESPQLLDVTGDGVVAPLDALRVIQRLNSAVTVRSGTSSGSRLPAEVTAVFSGPDLAPDAAGILGGEGEATARDGVESGADTAAPVPRDAGVMAAAPAHVRQRDEVERWNRSARRAGSAAEAIDEVLASLAAPERPCE